MTGGTLHQNAYIREFGTKPIPLTLSVLTIILLSAGLWISIENGVELFFLGGLLSIPFIYILIKYPKYWLYMSALLGAFFFRASEEGISAIDVFSGLFYIGGIYIWLFHRVLIAHEKLVRNFGDWVILLFFALLPLNLIIALLNGVEILSWVKEFGFFSLILYYLPFREILQNKKDFRNILLLYLITTLILDFVQFYQYYKITFSDLTYAFQLSSSVRYNQPLFTSAAIFGILFSLYIRNRIAKILMLLFSTLTIMALIATFSRAFWIMLMVNVLLIVFLINRQHRKKFIIMISSNIILFSTIALLLFSDKVEFLFYVMEKRLSSAGEGTKDLSIQMRLNEYNAVLEQIEKYPIGGSGLTKTFAFYDPIGMKKVDSNFVHNAYIFTIYRIGIPLALVFILFLLYQLTVPIFLLFRTKDDYWRMVLIGSWTSVLMMVVTNFITTTYFAREGTFVLALSAGAIGIISEKIKKLGSGNL